MEWLPGCLVLGITEEKFWSMNPHTVKPYLKAAKLRNRQRDEEMWIQGRYIYEAVVTAVENNLAGKKSRLTYRDKSYSKEYEETHLSEEQKKQQTIALFKKLEMMQTAFEKNHPKDEQDG